MIPAQHKFGQFWILQHWEPYTSGYINTWIKHPLELFFQVLHQTRISLRMVTLLYNFMSFVILSTALVMWKISRNASWLYLSSHLGGLELRREGWRVSSRGKPWNSIKYSLFTVLPAHQVVSIVLYLNASSSPFLLLQNNKGLMGFMYKCLFLLKTSVIFCSPNVPIINVNGEKY